MIYQTNKYTTSFISNDKENNSEVCNSGAEGNLNYNKRRSLLSQQNISVLNQVQHKDAISEITNNTNNIIKNNSFLCSSLNQSKTEEALKEIARKVNAEKVKKSLNTNESNHPISNPTDYYSSKLQNNDNEKPQPLQSDQPDSLNTQQNQNQEYQSLNLNAVNTIIINNNKNNLNNNSSLLVNGNGNNSGVENKLKNKIDYRDAENNLLLQNYSNKIMEQYKEKEKETTPQNYLSKHNIPANLRAKMVDWMIEVLCSYKCTEQTFFFGVRLMDHYFQKSQRILDIQDLHLSGVTCMFIACKYEEIYPMKLQVVHDKIAHKKLSIEQIKLKESEILQTLNFQVIGVTPYEIAMHTLIKTQLKEILNKKIFAYLEKICVYLAKMILYDYELISNKQYSLLAGACIFVAFKIIEQIEANFKAEEQVRPVLKILNLEHDLLIETAAKILTLAKSFDKLYPNLENLKKFNGFTLDDTECNIKK